MQISEAPTPEISSGSGEKFKASTVHSISTTSLGISAFLKMSLRSDQAYSRRSWILMPSSMLICQIEWLGISIQS